jgi:hypothetical protein
MADAPWRCSQCGTINEPVANACRTCGRWPSLFDLQESRVDEADLENVEVLMPQPVEVAEVGEAEAVEPEAFEPEAFEVEKPDAPESEPESASARGRRIFGSIIVPLAVVIYLVITFIVNR